MKDMLICIYINGEVGTLREYRREYDFFYD